MGKGYKMEEASRMTLEEKIGQMILASIEVSRMDAGTREFLRKKASAMEL